MEKKHTEKERAGSKISWNQDTLIISLLFFFFFTKVLDVKI